MNRSAISISAAFHRFGPQTSVSVKLTQNLFGFEQGMVHTRGRHLIKAGGLIERYQDNMVNPRSLWDLDLPEFTKRS